MAGGCTACGSEDTVTMDGINGRRCATDAPAGAAPLLGDYDRSAAMSMVDAGNPAGAFSWLRHHLGRLARGDR